MVPDGIRRTGPVVKAAEGEEVLVGAQLGWLYLQQGHLADAEEVFRAVLTWRETDTEALRGLEEARSRRAASEEEPGEAVAQVQPSTARRKIARLRRYLGLIEGRAGTRR